VLAGTVTQSESRQPSVHTSPATPDPDHHRTDLDIDRDGLIAFCRDLVRARSVHDPAAGLTERPAAELVAAKMREFGWEPRVEEVTPGRPNVLATVAGGGHGPTIAFVGHTDVGTEGRRSDWTVDPFGGEIRDGRLYGRGSADMKSGLAAAIFAVRALQLAGPFPGRIALCALVDEEGLMLGAKHLAASGLLAGAAGAIVCEPEGGEICTMAKGAIRLRLDLQGTMAHGAMPHLGRNPVSAAGLLLAALDRLQDDIRAENAMPAAGVDTMSIAPTALLAGNAQQLNVIPGHAVLYLDIRTTPVIDHGGLLARIADLAERVTGPAGIGTTVTVIDDRPAVEIGRSHPIVAALSAAHQRIHGEQAPFGIVPGTTDGTILTRDAGLPTVVYGPGGKWIAHQADEFVEVAEIEDYALVYAEAARAFLSGASTGASIDNGGIDNGGIDNGGDSTVGRHA
jgi:succinyl-diaminopimelate desuccinylase